MFLFFHKLKIEKYITHTKMDHFARCAKNSPAIVDLPNEGELNVSFNFRAWRAHLKKLAVSRNDGNPSNGNPSDSTRVIFPTEKKIDLVREYMTRYYSKKVKFDEPELRQYFALYPHELQLSHRDLMQAYKEYIRRKYLGLFGAHLTWPIGGYDIENMRAIQSEINNWDPEDNDRFNIMVLQWEKYLCDVDYKGRIPAIALLGLRRRTDVHTLLHDQPTDVIRIIAKICLKKGWVFAWKVNHK